MSTVYIRVLKTLVTCSGGKVKIGLYFAVQSLGSIPVANYFKQNSLKIILFLILANLNPKIAAFAFDFGGGGT